MRYGLKLSQRATIDEYRAVWRIADEAGFDHCWNMDHFATLGDDVTGDIFDAWTLLAAMAETTTRTRIGCMVTGNTYRHPGVLAKIATTVDHLSGGRLEFGIGGAWAEYEHTMFDLEFGTAGQRLDRLDEACRIIRSLWTSPRTTFAGQHYRIEDAVAEPKPLQQPYPPIWIGGNGRKRTLRIAAQYADVWNALGGGGPEEFAELSGVLDGHCADVGRDPAEIRRTVQLPLDGAVDDVVPVVEQYARAGVDDVILIVRAKAIEEQAEQAAALLPRLREIG
ncbi:F420-dependent oxidoreductase-like protein [Haloactinopolyspora alba]|uniref:F420-dependent oxidoreductase-like protein n=1 Tax=Haloactinopolyspora alba TaxID=648780 RepID=A0A2P8E8T5_9ACTN|nr:LLM class F420-dependent oxidoreductase [Haloactinopolyspora alba]PSL05874.1 F420-dependent oxidoreductase-like protein [Haloactinopolyspora alba]